MTADSLLAHYPIDDTKETPRFPSFLLQAFENQCLLVSIVQMNGLTSTHLWLGGGLAFTLCSSMGCSMEGWTTL